MATLFCISGVTGMTGNELVRQILKKPDAQDAVIGFDNFFASSIETVRDTIDDPRFSFFEYDITNGTQMRETEALVRARKQEFDRTVYINCAAVVHTEYFYRVNETFDVNVNGMRAFLEQAIRVEADCYINCSTSEVYSMQSWNETGGMREDDFLTLSTAEHSQRTSYATGKLLTEFFMKDAVDNGKIKGCSIRFANVYSKNERFAKHIIPHIIGSLLDTGKVVLLDNSKKNRRTFLHNIDSCGAVLALIVAKDALDGSVYNVATDEEITILDLVALCAAKMGIEHPEIVFEGHRESDPERRLLSTEKIRTRTGWKPVVTLDEGIAMCVESYTGDEHARKMRDASGNGSTVHPTERGFMK